MTAGERSGQLKRMELRARQRSNYDRLLSRYIDTTEVSITKTVYDVCVSFSSTMVSVAVYHQAMVVVVLLMCESVSHLPLDSGCDQGHIK